MALIINLILGGGMGWVGSPLPPLGLAFSRRSATSTACFSVRLSIPGKSCLCNLKLICESVVHSNSSFIKARMVARASCFCEVSPALGGPPPAPSGSASPMGIKNVLISPYFTAMVMAFETDLS